MTTKLIVGALFLALPAIAADGPAVPALTAVIGPVFGSAQSQAGDSDVWFFAKLGRKLTPGSVVKTQGGSYCVVLFSDGTKLRLMPQTELRLSKLSAGATEISLASGRLEAWVKKRTEGAFAASGPTFSAELGEGTFAAEILSKKKAALDAFLGEASVKDKLGHAVKLSAGQRVVLSAASGASAPAPLPKALVRPEEPSLMGPAKPAAGLASSKGLPSSAMKW